MLRYILCLALLGSPCITLAGDAEIIKSFERNDYEAFEELYEQAENKSLHVTRRGTVTPFLFLSLYVKDPRFFEKILSEADLNAAGDWGMTGLHGTATLCDFERAKALVQRGADLSQPTDGGSTPLHIAVSAKCYEVAKYLIEAGANRYATDRQGRTPADIARALGDNKLEALLE